MSILHLLVLFYVIPSSCSNQDIKVNPDASILNSMHFLVQSDDSSGNPGGVLSG